MKTIRQHYRKALARVLQASSLALLPLLLCSCEAGDIGSSTNNASIDQSDQSDNSTNGVSSCHFNCQPASDGGFVVTFECTQPSGDTQIVDGPDLIDSLPDDRCDNPEEQTGE